MISSRLVKYLFFAIAACALFNLYVGLNAEALGLVEFFLSVIFGIVFHSWAIMRLRIFREYYRPDPFSAEQNKRSAPNFKAALILSALFTGIAAAVVYWSVIDGEKAGVFAFCAAIAAAAMSFYREPA